jgi:putative sugar O-methyltransferase
MNSKTALSLLQIMLGDINSQKEIYQPTTFWAQASINIGNELITHGLDSFRSLPIIHHFFAPHYGPPFNRLSNQLFQEITTNTSNTDQKNILTHMLNGEMWALSDYRTVMAGNRATDSLDLSTASESKIGSPAEHFQFDNKWFSRSFLNYLLGLSFLKQHVDTNSIQRVVEIGGGFGSLGEILSQVGSYSYVNIDIPPTAAVSSYYLSKQPQINLIPYTQTRTQEIIPFPEDGTQLVLCPWQLPQLQGDADLFVNFISFQEMEPNIVEHYLQHIDRLNCKFVLLRNLREGKQQKTENSLGVKQPILGEDYDNFLPNYQLLSTNVIPFGFQTLDGFHSELRLYKRIKTDDVAVALYD